jgi:hypothetical protein
MVSKFLKTSFLFGLLFLAATAFAQPVQVSVALAPPYPIHLEDYAQMKGQIIVSLVNTSQTFLQLRLVPSVQGQNGVSATIKPGYRPSTPLTLGPLETKVLTGSQLQALNMGLSLENMDIKGVNVQQIIRTETLPEGMYDLCIRAFDFNSNTQLSKDGIGCAMFNITWYDPPVIMNPADKTQVQALTPQFVNISWTPAGLGGVTRYRLTMMDMTANGLFNPNDAFDMGFPPFFQKENLITLGYPYSLAEPPLIVGHKYALRVQAYDPQGKLKYKNDGRSAVTTFTYGFMLVANDPTQGGGGGIDIPFNDLANAPQEPNYSLPDPNDPNTCMSAAACEIAMPSAATQYSPKTGDTVLVGKFRMVISSIAGGTGEGNIFVNFLQTRVKVKFENLQVNGQKQAYGNTKAWADIDKANLVELAMAKDPAGELTNIKVKDINDYIASAQKKVSKFTGESGQPTGVPFALDNAKGQNLILLGLIFTPTKAQANMVFGLAVQEALNNDWLQLGKKGICIRPNGFGLDGEGKIALPNDKSIAVSDKTNMVFKGGMDNTFLSFTCQGITKVQLKGGFEFSRDLVLPLNAQSQPVAAPAKLAANFTATVDHALNWTADATLSHPKFALPKLEDIVFAAENLLIDQSEVASVAGMQFPANHPKKNQNENSKKSWKGVYLGTCSVTLPSWMKGKNDAAVGLLNLKDLLIDKTGLWVKVNKIGELLKIGDGSLSGWGFSIDTVQLDVQASQIAGGGLGGKLQLPITEVGLGYSATISKGDKEANFSFSVKTNDEITVDAFIAKATLAPNSWLKVEKDGGKYRPEAFLNGSITVGWEEGGDNEPDVETNSVASFKMPTLNFSDFHIRNNAQGKPEILQLKIPFDNKNVPKNDQHKLAGFPLKLGGIEVKTQGQLKIAFGLDITLSKGETGKNGLSGSAGFSIYGKYDETKKRFVYDHTELDSIGIDMDISVAKVVGSLWMYKGNFEYGNGFKGSIAATIKGVGTKVSVTLQVGNKGKDEANFDYFYFDGLVQFGAGFQIPGTMASIYGFGGGVWYNMTRGALPNYSFDEFDAEVGDMSEAGSSPTGVNFTPMLGSSGFSAKVIFGVSGGKDAAAALNGDLELRIYISKQFGLDSMVLEGHGYAMQQIEDRGSAKVEGEFYMKIDFVMPSFTLNAGLGVNIAGVITGQANLNMHFSPQAWYINLGKWDTESQAAQDVPWDNDLKRCSLAVNLKVVPVSVKFVAYFMMGSKMPELPPLPLAIRSSLKGQNGQPMSDSRPAFPAFEGNNPGFAFGVASATYFKVKALILYASLDFKLGFDVLLKKYDKSQICEGTSLGINNWYAQGQAFAQLGIGAGIDINLFVWKGEWELFYVEATAYLYGSFPNPNYFRGTIAVHGEALGGLIKVDKSFDFETGKKPCINFNPFGDYPIVSDMNPRKMEGKKDKIQVYEDIHLAFNFPKGEFKVWNSVAPEEPARTCYYKIEHFSVKHGNTPIKFKPIEYTPDGYAARYSTDGAFFPPNATLKFKLEVRGYVKGEAKQYPLESYNFDFATGNLPKKIVGADLEKTCPLPKQRFFLQRDVTKGFVQWKPNQAQKQAYLFQNTDDGGGLYDLSKTKFYVCFTELKTNKRVYKDFNYLPNQDQLTFDLPGDLKNSTIYGMKIVKQMTTFPKPAEDEEDMGGGGGWGGGGGNDQDGWEYESGNYTESEWKQISQGAYRVNRLLKPDTSIHKVQIVLYELYFRTSKFNRLSDKMATYVLKGKGVFEEELGANTVKRTGPDNNPTYGVNDYGKVVSKNPILFMGGDENFDQYDAYGYTLSEGEFKIKVDPLLQFGASGSEKFPTWFYDRYEMVKGKYDSDFYEKVEDVQRYPGDKMVPASNPSFLELRSGSPWGAYKEFWRNSKYGSVLPYKPANVQVGLPAPVLWKHEIDAAKAEAPQQGNGNINNFVINVNVPGNGIQHGNFGLSNAGQICIPVVDYSSALIIRDYRLYMNRGWGHIRTHYDYPSQQNFLENAYDYMQDYLAPRTGKTYGFKMGGKTFSYEY